MLPKFPDLGAAEAAVGTGPLLHGRHEMGEVSFHISLDTGASPAEMAKPQPLVAHQLIVGRILERQKARGKGLSLWGSCAAVVSGIRVSRQDLSALNPSRAKLVKTGLGKAQNIRGLRGRPEPEVKIGKDTAKKILGLAMKNLFLFKM